MGKNILNSNVLFRFPSLFSICLFPFFDPFSRTFSPDRALRSAWILKTTNNKDQRFPTKYSNKLKYNIIYTKFHRIYIYKHLYEFM